MPPQQGVGLDEVERNLPGATDPSEQKQNQAVAPMECWPAHASAHHDELLPEQGVLSDSARTSF